MKSLTRLRAQIESIDARIVGLLNERLALSIRIGQVKKRTGCASFFPDREEYLLRLLEEKNRGGRLAAAHLRAIYREIFSSSRAEQKPLTVGTLGAPVSPSLLAARSRFGAGEAYQAHRTVAALLLAARKGKIDLAVLPAADLLRALARNGRALGSLRVRGEIREGKNRFYLLGREAADEAAPEGKSLWLLQGAGFPAIAGAATVIRAGTARLVETAAALPAPALRRAAGAKAKLRLLGSFAAPTLSHGR